jgi:hypothetical protein
MRCLIVLVLLLSACATNYGKKLNHVSIGMTKEQVIDVMGEPTSTKSDGTQEALEYENNCPTGFSGCHYWGKQDVFWVIFVDGKVNKYGRAGDFGTAGPLRSQVDVNGIYDD